MERFERHPVMMALSTDDDRPLDWLRPARRSQHALLAGTRFSMSAPGGRSTPYRQQLDYGPLNPHRLPPRPAVPAGYAVEASFLTQSLELADMRHRVTELAMADQLHRGAADNAPRRLRPGRARVRTGQPHLPPVQRPGDG